MSHDAHHIGLGHTKMHNYNIILNALFSLDEPLPLKMARIEEFFPTLSLLSVERTSETSGSRKIALSATTVSSIIENWYIFSIASTILTAPIISSATFVFRLGG
jgi:hypothetical protein